MGKFISRIFGRLFRFGTKEAEAQDVILPKKETETEQESAPIIAATPTIKKKRNNRQKKQIGKKPMNNKNKPKGDSGITMEPRNIRDIVELMEVPIVSLSKNRKTPIIYETDSIKVRITCHSEHYIASIYDWDIVLCIAGKIQEAINSGQDIPSRKIIIPRHELLKELHKHDGKKEEKDLKASLSRLTTTLIKTTIFNEDGRYEDECHFLEGWGYTDRKDVKEFRIIPSQWLYDGICQKGSMLKINPEYLNITSGLKKFLYRTARKHAGNKNWEFSVEDLHKKSGSEQELKFFKRDLRKSVSDNDLPGYFVKWVEKDRKAYVSFINKNKELKEVLSKPSAKPSLPSPKDF